MNQYFKVLHGSLSFQIDCFCLNKNNLGLPYFNSCILMIFIEFINFIILNLQFNCYFKYL